MSNVSGKAPKQTVGKAAVECPHCGFKQLESAFVQSTFCRKCGEHYELGKPKELPREEGPSLLNRFLKYVSGNRDYEITCFHCSRKQIVNSSAKSSSCPHCGVYIVLEDYKIKEAFNKSIETQGVVHVTAKGDVSSPKIACREAFIQGKMRGNLLCTGEVRVKLKGKLAAAIDAGQFTVEKRSNIEASRPMRARSATIYGTFRGRLDVDGTVTIAKKGYLEGTVHAKGITVEKGGVFSGQLVIGRPDLSSSNLELPVDFIKRAPGEGEVDEDTLRFGLG